MTINTISTVNTTNTANTATTANTSGAADSAAGTSASTAKVAESVTIANNTASAIVTITAGNNTGQAEEVAKSETTQAGQAADSAQVQNGGAGKDIASSQAFSVALKGTITAEISELARLVAVRTAVVQNLPPEIRELVQQVLSQNQAAQSTLTEGLVALLKSPKTVSENLSTLVELMETATGLSNQTEAQPGIVSRTNANKQEVSIAVASAWQGATPEDLTSAAKVLRELADLLQPSAELHKQQEPAANIPQAKVAANTQPDMLPPTTSQQLVAQSPDKTAATATVPTAITEEQGELQPGSKGDPQTANLTKQAEVSQRQQMATVGMPNLEANSVVSEKNKAAQQLPQNLQNLPSLQKLPPELKEFVLSLLQQETQTTLSQEAQTATSQATQKPEQLAQNPQPLTPTQNVQSGQVTQTQPGNQLPLPQTTVTAENPRAQVQQTNMPLSQVSAAATPTLQTVPQQQVSILLSELMVSLNKSHKTPAEKVTELANFMEQALKNIASPEPGKQQTSALRQQAMLEMAEILQEKTPEELKAAIKVVRELADTMGKPSGVTAERQEGQKVLTMAIPLYFGEGQTVYPAYIHVYYQQEEDKKNPGQKVSETWLRICLETENIGIVDAAFRLYDEDNLDVKVRFAEEEAAADFSQGIEEVKEQLKKLPLTLGDFLVK